MSNNQPKETTSERAERQNKAVMDAIKSGKRGEIKDGVFKEDSDHIRDDKGAEYWDVPRLNRRPKR